MRIENRFEVDLFPSIVALLAAIILALIAIPFIPIFMVFARWIVIDWICLVRDIFTYRLKLAEEIRRSNYHATMHRIIRSEAYADDVDSDADEVDPDEDK